MRRPTFFLSSTIYDFSDLRSALKFYLEEQGCKVLASECNDFTVNPDKHSYDACLEAIQRADYFVLLIGSRVGGWYDEGARISITQREYREACELQKVGKIKLLNFVREDVWCMRQERQSLRRCIKNTNINLEVKSEIINHQSKFAENANFTISFINEVARNSETKAAVKGEGPAPVGNWIKPFREFRDIARAIDHHLLPSEDIDTLTAKGLVRREVREILRRCLVKYKKGNVFTPFWSVHKFHRENPFDLETRKQEYVQLETKSWDHLCTVAFSLLNMKIKMNVLPEVLTLKTFLDFDLERGVYRETKIYLLIQQLVDEIHLLNDRNDAEALSVLFKYSPKGRGGKDVEVFMEPVELFRVLYLMDRWSNVVELAKAVHLYIDSGVYKEPRLRPCSPLRGMPEEIAEETVNDEELDKIIENDD